MIKKEIVAAELKRIEGEGGALTPHAVVEAARASNSLLHLLFDWDNSSAGEKYRLWQARQLISVQRTIFQEREVHQYYNIELTEDQEAVRAYFPLEQVMSKEALYKQALASAVKDLEVWLKRYEDLKGLKNVVNLSILEQARGVVASV